MHFKFPNYAIKVRSVYSLNNTSPEPEPKWSTWEFKPVEIYGKQNSTTIQYALSAYVLGTLRVVGTNWGHAHDQLLGGCILAIKRLVNMQPAAT